MKVKFLSVTFYLVSLLAFVSCSQDDTIMNSEANMSTFQTKMAPKCPDGYTLVKYVDFDGVNFRTRKSNCNSNFGLFCLVNKTVTYECIHYLTGDVQQPLDPTLKEKNGAWTTMGVLTLVNGGTHAELRLPGDLINFAPNGVADFNQFDVE